MGLPVEGLFANANCLIQLEVAFLGMFVMRGRPDHPQVGTYLRKLAMINIDKSQLQYIPPPQVFLQ